MWSFCMVAAVLFLGGCRRQGRGCCCVVIGSGALCFCWVRESVRRVADLAVFERGGGLVGAGPGKGRSGYFGSGGGVSDGEGGSAAFVDHLIIIIINITAWKTIKTVRITATVFIFVRIRSWI